MNAEKKQNVLIVGIGKSGMAAADLLSKQNVKITAYDDRIEESFSKEDLAWLAERRVHCFFARMPEIFCFETVVMSPGLSPNVPVVENAKKAGAEIIGELELAYRYCKGSFVAITGTNGKTTTTALVGEMYQLAGMPHEIVGNIGLPASERALLADEKTTMITEVSSFQLETTWRFHPKISAILNITPDHLDRHGSMDEYIKTKAKIFKNQTKENFFVYNADDPICVQLAKTCSQTTVVPFSREKQLSYGAYVNEGKLVVKDQKGSEIYLCNVSDLLIPGMHNLENALAAAAIGYFSGLPIEAVISALTSFAGVEHRIEFVCEKKGVRYVNDSKGTNPDASIKAIEATDTPILLIAGGYEKHSDFNSYIEAFDGKVKYLLVLGETATRIADSATELGFPKDKILFCESMKACVEKAQTLAVGGDTVLLSPACASWGMYKNFEERGKDFKQLALSIDK